LATIYLECNIVIAYIFRAKRTYDGVGKFLEMPWCLKSNCFICDFFCYIFALVVWCVIVECRWSEYVHGVMTTDSYQCEVGIGLKLEEWLF